MKFGVCCQTAWGSRVAIYVSQISWPPLEIKFASMEGPPVVMKPEDDGKERAPTLSLTAEKAQQLMDDLWQCGLRPSEGSGSAGQLAAVERHLEDFRRLVFKDKYEKNK